MLAGGYLHEDRLFVKGALYDLGLDGWCCFGVVDIFTIFGCGNWQLH